MKQIGFILLLVVICAGFAAAQSPESMFQQANQLYQQGKVVEAKDLYETILRNGNVSGDLCYNLGNAYYKAGNIPRAILFYERALRLIPNDDDLRHNLQLANLMITDRIEPAPKLFIWEYWDGLKDLFSVRSATWFAYLGYLLVVVSIVAFVLARRYALRKAALIVGGVSGVLFLLCLTLFFAKVSDVNRTDEAILQSGIITVKNSPDAKSSDAFVLHGGVKVKIVDRVGDWVKIRLVDGKVGWMEVTAAETI
jgi:tetratricopeptide (TPR) repeat protein